MSATAKGFLLAAIAALAGVGCLGEPISKKIGPGGTITLTLAGVRSGVVLGYGSTLGGPDVQRGQLRFVLCPMSSPPLCATGATAVPRGFLLETLFVTRSATDSVSPAGLDGVDRSTTAVIQIPAMGDQRPEAGTYRLEPRIVTPQGVQSLAVEDAFLRTLEVTAENAPPSPLTEGNGTQADALQLATLPSTVPRPALGFLSGAAAGQTTVEAAELEVSYPSSKVRIAGAASATAALIELVNVDASTVRIVFVRKLPQPSIEQIFELAFELLPNVTAPVTPGEFGIVKETVFDQDGTEVPGGRIVRGTIS